MGVPGPVRHRYSFCSCVITSALQHLVHSDGLPASPPSARGSLRGAACGLLETGTPVRSSSCLISRPRESVMEWFAKPARIPGDRIAGYRNSLPRRIRLFGLGERGSRVAHEIAARAYRNVEVAMDGRPIGW